MSGMGNADDFAPLSEEKGQPRLDERLVHAPTENERAASLREVRKLHPGNRFRLMAGLPLLPDEPVPVSRKRFDDVNDDEL
jgi:hypothetical protein